MIRGRATFQIKFFAAALSAAVIALAVAGLLFATTMRRQIDARIEATLEAEARLSADLLARGTPLVHRAGTRCGSRPHGRADRRARHAHRGRRPRGRRFLRNAGRRGRDGESCRPAGSGRGARARPRSRAAIQRHAGDRHAVPGGARAPPGHCVRQGGAPAHRHSTAASACPDGDARRARSRPAGRRHHRVALLLAHRHARAAHRPGGGALSTRRSHATPPGLRRRRTGRRGTGAGPIGSGSRTTARGTGTGPRAHAGHPRPA